MQLFSSFAGKTSTLNTLKAGPTSGSRVHHHISFRSWKIQPSRFCFHSSAVFDWQSVRVRPSVPAHTNWWSGSGEVARLTCWLSTLWDNRQDGVNRVLARARPGLWHSLAEGEIKMDFSRAQYGEMTGYLYPLACLRSFSHWICRRFQDKVMHCA